MNPAESKRSKRPYRVVLLADHGNELNWNRYGTEDAAQCAARTLNDMGMNARVQRDVHDLLS